jgi:pimeloyl-ACP methyl ester carboxylesterase
MENNEEPLVMPKFVLVHSPLVGPLTWTLVADELRKRGVEAILPTLLSDERTNLPFWEQHARAVIRTLASVPQDEPLILIGHSGAGVLLPAIRQTVKEPVAGYIFVDAGIPVNGKSRLDLFGSPQEAEQFRQSAANGFLPTWNDQDLRDSIFDDELRGRFVAELRPLPVAVYEEPIPVFEGWPDAPCGYLLFSPTYEAVAEQAQRAGWAYAQIDAGHFHMLVDPPGVANALTALVEQMQKLSDRQGKQ